MAKVKTDSIDEKVFTTKGSKLDEAAVLSTGSESASSGFDPHFITEKIIEFGMALTGMPLYQYQKDSAYRIIHSVVAKEGETITMLFSRQCFGRGTMIQTYDFGVKGCKPVEEIKNGDYVVSPENFAVEVKNYHSGTDEMYIVVPHSDFLFKPYKVNSQHVLAVHDTHDGQFKNVTVDEYINMSIEEKMSLRGYGMDEYGCNFYRLNIIPNGKGEYFGFEIDNEVGLFLLEDNSVVHNSGKSETMAFVIDTLCVILPVLGKVIPELAEYTTGFRVGLFAPQSDQVTTTYQRAMSRLKSSNASMVMEDADIDTKLVYDARLVLSNGSSLMGQTAAKTSKIESKTYDLIIIEEAQDTDDLVVSKSIESMGAACLMAGSKVVDKNGNIKNIEDVKFYDELVGFNEITRTIEHGKVTWLKPPAQKECVKITTSTGRSLSCSIDHPILHKERKGGAYGKKIRWVDAGNLSVGDHVCTADVIDYWGSESLKDARLIGLLIGDGNYSYSTTPMVSLSDHEIKDFLLDNYDACVNKGSEYLTKDGKQYCEINVRCICEDLRNLGIYGQVGKAKRLPKDFSKYCKKDLADLLGGYFDADGCVLLSEGRRCYIELGSISKPLLEQVFLLLQKFGIHSSIKFCKPRKSNKGTEGIWKLAIKDKRSIVNFHANISFIVKYKQDTLCEGVKILSEHKEKIDAMYPSIRIERIISVEPLGVNDIYNLSVSGINTYLGNGIVTHNTYATFVKLGTTGMRKGDFWYEIQRNVKRSTGAHKGKLRYHFEFNYLEIIKQKRAQYAKDGNLFHLNYEKFIKKQIEKRGIQSDSFKLAFALIWALDGGMFLSDTDWNNMLNRKKNFIRVVEPNWDIRAGIDIAKDRASTVITIGRVIPEFVGVPPRKEVIQWVELGGMDYELQHQQIVQVLIDYGVSIVYIDYTGVGKPVVDRLTHAIGHFITVVPYTFSRPSKSEMWIAWMADIQAKRFIIPATQQARDSAEYKNAEIQMKGLTKRYEGGYLVAEKGSEHELDDYCLSMDTEILTSTGFKSYSELTIEDLVANYDIMDNSVSYSNPLRIICKEYKGDMIRLVGEHIEFNVTENHKVPLLRRTSNGKVGRWVNDVVMSQDVLRIKQSNLSSRMFPYAGFVNGNSEDLSIDEVRLLAYMITEGWRSVRVNSKGVCKYRYSNAQNYLRNFRNCVEMERVFDSVGLSYSIHDKKNGMRFYQFKACNREYFDALLYRGMHVFPTDILYTWSKDKLQAFYIALMNADGGWGRKTYSNKRLQFIEGFQLLCHLIGKGCRIIPHLGYGTKSTYLAYVFENAHLHSSVQKCYSEHYEGSVWCVTVKSGFILTRLNRKIGVTGNCDSMALMVMAGNAELTASTNVEFSDENPFYQNAGVLNTIQTTSW